MSVAVAVDVVVLTIEGTTPRFLAVRRDHEPFEGCLALPGVRLGTGEDLEHAAARALHDVAGLPAVHHLEQLATFGRPDRDPRGRVVSVSYLGLLPRPIPGGSSTLWTETVAPPALAFDHGDILGTAVERLRGKLSYSNVAYGLLDERFTLTELQEVYEVVLGRGVDKRNFRKKVLAVGMVTETEGMRRGAHRPAQLYRFAHTGLVLLDDAIAP